MAEQFKIHLKSLLFNEIEETENDFRINADSMTRIRHKEFFIFYYLTGQMPHTKDYLFIPDREKPQEIEGS